VTRLLGPSDIDPPPLGRDDGHYDPGVVARARSAPDESAGLGPQVGAVEAAITDLFRLASSRRLHQARQERSGVHLSRTGWELLRRVEDLGPIRVSRLAELMDLSLPVTSRALQRLEDDGLVARRPDPDDGRAACFVATRAGARARARIQAAMHDELATVLAAWPEPERRRLAELLPRLVADMRAVGASPPPHL
jgi:DNA-binding MarR family transcriptional regulator